MYVVEMEFTDICVKISMNLIIHWTGISVIQKTKILFSSEPIQIGPTHPSPDTHGEDEEIASTDCVTDWDQTESA